MTEIKIYLNCDRAYWKIMHEHDLNPIDLNLAVKLFKIKEEHRVGDDYGLTENGIAVAGGGFHPYAKGLLIPWVFVYEALGRLPEGIMDEVKEIWHGNESLH